MEDILVKPRNKRQLSFIKTMLEYGNVHFESIIRQEEEKPEGDRYYPILDEKIKKALEAEKEGDTMVLKTTDSLDDFWEKIMADESI